MPSIKAWKSDTEGLFIEMDAGELKDYSVDWVDFLDGAALELVETTIPAGISQIGAVQIVGNVSQILLSADGQVGVFACSWKLTFGAGRVEIVKFRVFVR